MHPIDPGPASPRPSPSGARAWPALLAVATAALLGAGCPSASEPSCVCDAAIRKVVLSPLVAGGTGSFGILVDYAGHPLCGDGAICVTDTLAPGLTLASAAPSDWTCTQTGQDVQCCLAGPLPVTHTALPMLVLTVNVAEDVGDQVENCAAIEQGQPDDFVDQIADNNQGCTTAPVTHPYPELSLDKRHEGTFTSGQTGVFTLGVTNHGTGPANNMVITDVLDPAFTFVSGAPTPPWSCTAAGQTVTCNYTGGPVPAMTSLAPLLLTVQVHGEPGEVRNCATVETRGDPRPRNNTSCDTVAVRPCALDRDLATGLDDTTLMPIAVGSPDDTWRVVASPNGLNLGAPIVNAPFWAPVFPGSLYVSPLVDGANLPSQNLPGGTFTYETCFCLADTFASPLLDLTMRADNSVGSVTLNGCTLANSSGGPFNPATGPALHVTETNPACFRPGENCVRINVRNDSSFSGLDVTGRVTATRSCCQ